MARQTRAQRRARREAQQKSGMAQRARQRQQQVRPAAQQPKSQTGARGGFGRFIGESWAELKKVEWPGQSQLIQGTTVVLIACAIVGLYLWLADLVFKPLVERVFLG